MKAIFIEPDKKIISKLDIEDFKEFYDLIQCELVEFVNLKNNLVLIVDEEGVIYDKRLFCLHDLVDTPSNLGIFAGNAIILQRHGDDFCDVPEDLEVNVDFFGGVNNG